MFDAHIALPCGQVEERAQKSTPRRGIAGFHTQCAGEPVTTRALLRPQIEQAVNPYYGMHEGAFFVGLWRGIQEVFRMHRTDQFADVHFLHDIPVPRKKVLVIHLDGFIGLLPDGGVHDSNVQSVQRKNALAYTLECPRAMLGAQRRFHACQRLFWGFVPPIKQ